MFYSSDFQSTPDWVQIKNNSSGKSYYWCKKTNETMLTVPDELLQEIQIGNASFGVHEIDPAIDEEGNRVPDTQSMWQRVVDSNGREYWWNTDTDETCWHLPSTFFPSGSHNTEEVECQNPEQTETREKITEVIVPPALHVDFPVADDSSTTSSEDNVDLFTEQTFDDVVHCGHDNNSENDSRDKQLESSDETEGNPVVYDSIPLLVESKFNEEDKSALDRNELFSDSNTKAPSLPTPKKSQRKRTAVPYRSIRKPPLPKESTGGMAEMNFLNRSSKEIACMCRSCRSTECTASKIPHSNENIDFDTRSASLSKLLRRLARGGNITDAVRQISLSAPFNIEHKIHVSFDEECVKYSGLPEDWYDLWADATALFEVSLSSCPRVRIPGYKERIPAVLVLLKKAMTELGGLSCEGIFRLAPDKDECDIVRKKLNTSWGLGAFEDVRDPHVPANLIKQFLRELRPNLLASMDYNTIIDSATLTNDLSCVDDVIEKIPEPDRSCLLWLLDTMADVAEKSDINRMSPKNLAIVVSPNTYDLLKCPPAVCLTASQKLAVLLENFLLWRMENRK